MRVHYNIRDIIPVIKKATTSWKVMSCISADTNISE